MENKDLEDRITYDLIYRIEQSNERIKDIEQRIVYDFMGQIEGFHKVINSLKKRLSDNEKEIDELKYIKPFYCCKKYLEFRFHDEHQNQ